MYADTPTDITQRLSQLHEQYTFLVNVAIEEGREDDIDGLVASFPQEAAELMAQFAARAA